MTLKNNKDQERNFKLLLKVENNNNSYLIYQDSITSKIYSGRKEKNKLKPLNEEELNFINNIIERIKG